MNEKPQHIGVLGAGTIGASWTALFLASGYRVEVYDAADTTETYVRDYVENAWPTLLELGLARNGNPGHLAFHPSPEAVAEVADFIQESVPEHIEIKHRLFSRIEPKLKSGAIVSSSASGLMVQEMQDGFEDPSRLILGHPFNPPHLIPLVELVANEKTSPGLLERAEEFYSSCGRITIRVNKEVPGHVANRLQAAIWREALHLMFEGVASVEDIDKAVWAGPGLRWAAMGPHMLFNLGSGGQGVGKFCERYAPSFHRWWDDLGQPTLTPDVISKLATGVTDAEHRRTFKDISDERDALIVAMLKATSPFRFGCDQP